MKLPNKKQLSEFEKWKVDPPSHEEHGTDSWEHPISEKMVQAKCWNWRLQGNQLLCDTDFGPMSQTIPPNYVCLGTDKKGLPILKQVVV